MNAPFLKASTVLLLLFSSFQALFTILSNIAMSHVLQQSRRLIEIEMDKRVIRPGGREVQNTVQATWASIQCTKSCTLEDGTIELNCNNDSNKFHFHNSTNRSGGGAIKFLLSFSINRKLCDSFKAQTLVFVFFSFILLLLLALNSLPRYCTVFNEQRYSSRHTNIIKTYDTQTLECTHEFTVKFNKRKNNKHC